MPNEPPAEIKAVIDTALGGFNDKDSPRYNSAFGGEVVIVDGIAPYPGPVQTLRAAGSPRQRSGRTISALLERIAYDKIITQRRRGWPCLRCPFRDALLLA